MEVRQPDRGRCWNRCQAWWKARQAKLSQKSDVAMAIRYALDRLECLLRFCEDGRVERTTMPPRRYGRRWARKTICLPDRDAGGERAAAIYSCWAAKLNGTIRRSTWFGLRRMPIIHQRSRNCCRGICFRHASGGDAEDAMQLEQAFPPPPKQICVNLEIVAHPNKTLMGSRSICSGARHTVMPRPPRLPPLAWPGNRFPGSSSWIRLWESAMRRRTNSGTLRIDPVSFADPSRL